LNSTESSRIGQAKQSASKSTCAFVWALSLYLKTVRCSIKYTK